MKTYGVDASPVAVAIAQAKFASEGVNAVLDLAGEILSTVTPAEVPSGEFWERAFHESTLEQVCALREGLRGRRISSKVAILRALCLGCLHGPTNKDPNQLSYFSNQMPRTFASKPDSAVRFWKRNRQRAPKVDVLRVIRRKAERALRHKHDSPNRPSNIPLGRQHSRVRVEPYIRRRGSRNHIPAVLRPPDIMSKINGCAIGFLAARRWFLTAIALALSKARQTNSLTLWAKSGFK